MPGGNTSSSTRKLKNLRGSSLLSNDVKHQNASEWIDDNKVDTPNGPDYKPDMNYGLPLDGTIQQNTEDTQGTSGWIIENPGPGITRPKLAGGSKDPTPGGGW